MKKVTVELKDGSKCLGDYFDISDYLIIRELFIEWKKMNKKLKSIGGRNLNIPDVLSESLFCICFNAVRTNGDAHSYDCVSLKNKAGIQLKSSSIRRDCTSFGPTSTWDELYFIDFAPCGRVDGNIYFYKIEEDISNIVLNKKGETFRDQQLQGRRPRFSIKEEIINKNNLSPIFKINLNEEKLVIYQE